MFHRNRLFAIAMLTSIMGMPVPLTLMAGDLNPPPGPVGPTMKRVDEIEPRIAVKSLPGSATAVHVISQPGSYYLTGNVTGESGKNGIEIVADEVSLDLNGFTLRGVPDSLSGVLAEGRRNIAVSNGSMTNWGSDGVRVIEGPGPRSDNTVIELIRSDHNGRHGIFAQFATITRCSVSNNANEGIEADWGLVADCRAGDNRGNGITLDQGTIVRCQANGNSGAGLYANGGTLITESSAQYNRDGIRVASNCVITHCYAQNNGVGIFVWDVRNRIAHNTVSADGIINGTGILVEDVDGRNMIMANSVQGYSTAYNIPAGNTYGPIVNVAGVGDIASIANANHPWANFEY